jgi:hypothetical protein
MLSVPELDIRYPVPEGLEAPPQGHPPPVPIRVSRVATSYTKSLHRPAGNVCFSAAASGLDLEALAARSADPRSLQRTESDETGEPRLDEPPLIFNFSRGWAETAKHLYPQIRAE